MTRRFLPPSGTYYWPTLSVLTLSAPFSGTKADSKGWARRETPIAESLATHSSAMHETKAAAMRAPGRPSPSLR